MSKEVSKLESVNEKIDELAKAVNELDDRLIRTQQIAYRLKEDAALQVWSQRLQTITSVILSIAFILHVMTW